MPTKRRRKKARRNYREEYDRYQSSPKQIRYRSQLNKYNRDHGKYGAKDGLDASHKNGKIVGYEPESVNRARREKSRLKGSKRRKR